MCIVGVDRRSDRGRGVTGGLLVLIHLGLPPARRRCRRAGACVAQVSEVSCGSWGRRGLESPKSKPMGSYVPRHLGPQMVSWSTAASASCAFQPSLCVCIALTLTKVCVGGHSGRLRSMMP